MFVVRATKQKRMIEMIDELTFAYIRWYFRTSAIEEDMVYIDDKKESYNFSIEDLLQENKSTPEKVVDELIFTKDKNDSLQINTEILDYISKTTTRENNAYLFSLENYAYKNRNREHWKISDRAKIGAYIFNTTYPLRKKYWADKFDEWYGGKPEELLGSGSYWQENNYYGLPKLEEYERDFRITYW